MPHKIREIRKLIIQITIFYTRISRFKNWKYWLGTCFFKNILEAYNLNYKKEKGRRNACLLINRYPIKYNCCDIYI